MHNIFYVGLSGERPLPFGLLVLNNLFSFSLVLLFTIPRCPENSQFDQVSTGPTQSSDGY